MINLLRRCTIGFCAIAAVVALLIASPSVYSQSAPAKGKLTNEQMAADLRQLAEVAKRAWSYAEDKQKHFGVDPDRILKSKLDRLATVRDDADFHQLLREFIADMKEGHAGVSFPGAAWPPYAWPLTLRKTPDGYIIDKVAADLAGPRTGDKLLKVDGVPIAVLLAQQLKIQTASTDGMREYYALRNLRFTRSKTLTLDYETPEGKSGSAEVKTVPSWWGLPSSPWEITWNMAAQEVGYVRVPSFAGNHAIYEQAIKRPGTSPAAAVDEAIKANKDQIRQAFAELAGTKAVILDVRGNSGGFDRLGMFLSQFLVAPQAKYYDLQTHLSPDLLQLPGWKGAGGQRFPGALVVDPSVTPYAGTVVILMDEGCFSATDNFLEYVAGAAPHIRLVGRPNGAGTGAPTTLATLQHSGAKVTFCVMRVWNHAGKLIEGRPLTPHVPVQWTWQQVRQGVDADLDAALKLLDQPSRPVGQ